MSLGCICYLVRNTAKDLKDFLESLCLLRDNYISRFPCNVLAFHEDIPKEVLDDIIRKSGIPIQFHLVFFKVPDGVKPNVSGRDLGYRHMCHFFANDIFHLPQLDPFEYYCRLDTDSKILSPVKFDLFEWMDRHNLDYGFICDTFSDQPFFCVGLWNRFQEFVNNNPQFKPYKKLYSEIPEFRVYYTNFEICDLVWFRSDPWKSFFNWVDLAQGIYTNRWGDHTIRYAGVNLFMEPKRIFSVPINYHHQFGFNHANVNT